MAARQARDAFPPNRSGVEGLIFEVLELVKKRDDSGFDYAGELKALEQIHRELQGLAP